MESLSSLVDLIGLETLQDLQERFYKATGFSNAYVDLRGHYVSKAGETAFVCMQVIRKNAIGRQRCIANNLKLRDSRNIKSRKPRIHRCHAGIWDASVPIVADPKNSKVIKKPNGSNVSGRP